jgi:hypothetical protein
MQAVSVVQWVQRQGNNMADFFKGLSGGFQSGLQIGEAMRAKQERERLREAMGLTPQEMQQRQASPEELGRAQAETQGLAAQDAAMFGLGPQEQAAYAPQMPVEGQRIGAAQYGLGGQTFNRMPTQQEIESARYSAAANVLAERDPVAAMRMRQEQVRMQREAELAPLQKQQLEGSIAGQAQQRELTGIQIGGAKRTAAEAQQMDDFNVWRSQNPQADFGAMTAKAQELGMGVDQQFKIASSLTGIGEQEFKASQQRIQKLVKNQGLDGLLKAHKESQDLDPGSHFEVIRGKGGAVSLNRVDTVTGQIIQPNVFSGSEAETAAYLNKAAMDPATIIDYTMNLEKGKAAIAASKASTAKDTAMAGLYNQGGAGAGKGTFKQKVADFKEVYGRDPTDDEKGVLAGLTNKPREFTAADVNARAKLMIDGGMMDPDDATKPLSPQKAIQMAQSELSGVPYVSPVDKLIADMAKARNAAAIPPAQQGLKTATPAGQQLLNLYNATTPPAPPPRSAPMTQQERLRAMSVPVR